MSVLHWHKGICHHYHMMQHSIQSYQLESCGETLVELKWVKTYQYGKFFWKRCCKILARVFSPGTNVVDSLWPSDIIMVSEILVNTGQLMAYCLMPPSHYLNQCCLAISEILWHSFQSSVNLNTQDINHQVVFEIAHLTWQAHFWEDNELIGCHWCLQAVDCGGICQSLSSISFNDWGKWHAVNWGSISASPACHQSKTPVVSARKHISKLDWNFDNSLT